eukprot:SAG31_NODE_4342_length_3337_cov_1.899012_2_plen_78_part_00
MEPHIQPQAYTWANRWTCKLMLLMLLRLIMLIEGMDIAGGTESSLVSYTITATVTVRLMARSSLSSLTELCVNDILS